MELPLVSLLMPVYQGQNHIKKSVDSVLKQSYINFELI